MGNGFIVTLSDKTYLNNLSYAEKSKWWYNIKKITPTEFLERDKAEQAKALLARRTNLEWKIESALWTGHYHEKKR